MDFTSSMGKKQDGPMSWPVDHEKVDLPLLPLLLPTSTSPQCPQELRKVSLDNVALKKEVRCLWPGVSLT